MLSKNFMRYAIGAVTGVMGLGVVVAFNHDGAGNAQANETPISNLEKMFKKDTILGGADDFYISGDRIVDIGGQSDQFTYIIPSDSELEGYKSFLTLLKMPCATYIDVFYPNNDGSLSHTVLYENCDS